jgi:hypothetical protein
MDRSGETDTDQNGSGDACDPVGDGVEAALYGGLRDESGDERAPAELDADDGQTVQHT